MASIPQLQADLGAMSLKLAKSEARVAELEAMPRRIVEVQVPVDRVVYRDREVIVEKRVEVPVEVFREVTRKVYDHAEIDRLGAVLVKREAEIARLKAAAAVKPEKVVEYVDREVIVEKPIKVIDAAEIDRLTSALDKVTRENGRLKSSLTAKPKVVTQYIDREVIKEVKVPVDRIVTVEVEKPYKVRDNSEIERLGNVIVRLEKENAKLKASANKPAVVIVKEVMVDK